MECKWIILVAVTLTGATRKEHRCFVCVPPTGSAEVDKLFPNSTIAVCGGALDVRVCPPEFKGCLTQYQGDIVARTCGALSLNHCLNVNQVLYCYCRGELCNSDASPSAVTLSAPSSDDEDLAEGSGAGPSTSTTATLPAQPTPVLTSRCSLLSSLTCTSLVVYIALLM